MRALVLFAVLASFASAPPRAEARSKARGPLSGRCRAGRGIGVLVSPQKPSRDQPLHVTFVSERARRGVRLVGKGPAGEHALKVTARGGPPYFWHARIAKPALGKHRFALVDADGKVIACTRRWVARRWRPKHDRDRWPVKNRWSRRMENYYSAWIGRLFDAGPGQRPGWTPLHQVLRDPERNILYNYLGGGEDGPRTRGAVVAKPDCADLPYFLRAYFAWKMRLPFGYRHCDRGSSRRPTRCTDLRTNVGEVVATSDSEPIGRTFSRFLATRVSFVHSASGRTAVKDDNTDLYPIRLSRHTLRPGTVYVDPYGHLLVISQWVPQTATRSGLLYAVDGHPDLSVGRKRFWRGAFMFKASTRGGAGGFKAFRPLVKRDGKIVALTNDEIKKSRRWRRVSGQQFRYGLEGFYDKMDEVINPRPLGPTQAYRERIKALHELLHERIGSVAAGEKHMRKTSYKTVKMPRGPRIFETSGAWENFSTPARDMRLLIAIHDVINYPAKVIKQPKRFALSAGQSPQAAAAAMKKLFVELAKQKTITYVKSDGSKKTLTMADVVARRKQLEIAYNPNDCVEIRWGASGSELASCKRHAPDDQLTLMAKYRRWFATRNRPPIR
ncbi:MAG: hypothetical protein KC503_35560 [Myxococcales bacterium]|nr:hypothetical protein [Myxococcales bacterium]